MSGQQNGGRPTTYEIARELEARSAVVTRRVNGFAATTALCGQCEHGIVYRRNASVGKGAGAGEPVTYCQRIGETVPNDIVECSGFSEPHSMDMTDMVRIALIIDPRPGVNGKSYL